MNRMNEKTLTVATMFIAAMLLASPAYANPAVGQNDVLDSTGGTIFIPLKSSTSGLLGTPITATTSVGLQSDTVLLEGMTTTRGWTSFLLVFDISGEVDPNFPIINSGTLFLSLEDLDFKPVVSSNYTHREMMGLTYIPDPNSFVPSGDGNTAPCTPQTADLFIDANNYGFFRGDGFGETNETSVLYEIDMTGDLGLTPADYILLTATQRFGLYVCLINELEHTREARDRLTNSNEEISGNDFVFVGVPEPGTIAVLLLGSCMGLLRRNKRRT